MQRALVVIGLASVLTFAAYAQKPLQSRTEVTKPTARDAEPNSDKVPDVYAITSQFQRVVVLRFKFNADLLAGLEKAVKDQNIKNAVILSGAGSLRNYHIHAVSNRDFPSKNIYIKDEITPADIISVNGYVIGGRVHGHMTLATDEGAFGGHIEPGCNVFTFAILTLGVLGDDIDLSKVDDKTYR